MKSIIKTSCGLTLLALLSGCGSSEGGFAGSGTSSTNIIWDFNFSIGFEEYQQEVVELPSGTLTAAPTLDFFAIDPSATPAVNILSTSGNATTNIVATAGDRLNSIITAGTVHISVQYGLIDSPTCELGTTGSCSVSWTSQTNIANLIYTNGSPLTFDTTSLGSDGVDLKNSVTIWAYGEETFVDLNGNGYFDDGESFFDVDEPYLDINDNGSYDAGEPIIDINTDLTHNTGDGLYNGTRCRHSTLCSPTQSIPIFNTSYIFVGYDGT